jgi:molybdopterin-guanine dinucleotide biosynthesis protein A
MGRTKALIEVDGVPMATRVAMALRAAGCVGVFGYGGDPDELASLAMAVLPDRYPGTGPLGGVLGVLEHFAELATAPEGVLIAACDLPALTGEALLDMVVEFQHRPNIDVVVARTSAIEPTCAIWKPSAIDRIRRCFDDGERALHAVIGQLAASEVVIDAAVLRNINTPDELGRYS